MAGLDGDFRQFDAPRTEFGRLRLGVSLTGAAISAALVIGLAVWGYRLAVRDVSGIPVVRAIEGPIRVTPEQPGGDIADYQGLAVNEIAAVGTASTPPERLMLAPRPAELALDDMAGLGPMSTPDTNAVVAESVQSALEPSATPQAVETEDTIAMALAEALADEEGAALVDEALPEGVISRSLRPVSRPGAGVGAVTVGVGAVADVSSTAAIAIVEIDPATLEPGTRLVQFGAFDTAEAARAEWLLLQSRFGDLMSDKSLVIEAATSGGRQFYRLRGHGFADETEARRFCSAMQTENAACIPVAHR